MFAGFAIGQLLFGPLSDSLGRKRSIYLGISVFLVGCGLSMAATSFPVMLLGRVLQGVGAASPRIITTAVVRDLYEGADMARITSLIMAVFVMVPAVAPSIGQGILLASHWRAIFGFLIVQSVGGRAVVWHPLAGDTSSEQPPVLFSGGRLGRGARGCSQSYRNRLHGDLGLGLQRLHRLPHLRAAALRGHLRSRSPVPALLWGAGSVEWVSPPC